MKRSPQKLNNRDYDVLVIGGGIYGACTAWDATLRGLSVALVEKSDFGAATSANSLKIIHGGLRYLQDGNLKLVRSMTKERATWLRIAPHLVHPLPFLMPTYRYFSRSKLALGAALAINDSIGFDRNRHVDPQHQLPNGRTLSRAAALDKMHWIDPEATGGAMWYDAQIYDSERLLISIISAAVEAGAIAANYVRVNGFLMDGRVISGVSAEDMVDGHRFDIRAKLVINCSGVWSDQVLGLLENRSPAPTFPLSAAINLLIRKLPLDCAIGITSNHPYMNGTGKNNKQTRMLFITPWQEYAIAGTWHTHFDGRPQEFHVTEEMIHSCIDELNAAYPVAGLRREDVYRVHCGFLPLDERGPVDGEVKLLRETQIHDHTRTDGVDNLITVTGVKYTTARQGAQRAVDLAMRKLERFQVGCQTNVTPVSGGEITSFNDYLAKTIPVRPLGISEQSMTHLVHSYGSNHTAVLDIALQKPDWAATISAQSPILKAEIIHAVRQEMAQTLNDVVYRRTPLGMAEQPDNQSLRTCASLMAAELGWDQAKREKEIAAATTEFIRDISLASYGAP
jgi:glycerol-3-phosphate dehydrogenase